MVKKVGPERYGRTSERGTTLFVVVLAITMLTGIGLYTVHSAALLARASGNERQAVQTEYLAQLGTLAALSQLSTSPQSYINVAIKGSKANNNTVDDCRMNQGVNTSVFGPPPCYEFPSSKFALLTGASLFDTDSFGTALDPATSAAAISGQFMVELTDVARLNGAVPGMDAVNPKAFSFFDAKLTTIAQLQPAGTGATCVQNVMQVTGQHLTRAHVRVGPVGGF
jgi:hypothetical protein